jgi:two-component system phosphate regulon sensor histidine kinase PhoR
MQVRRRVARLIDDLLSLSRISCCPSAAEIPVDLAPIVRQVVDGAKRGTHRGVEIKVLAPSDTLMVRGDRDELVRFLENLVGALKRCCRKARRCHIGPGRHVAARRKLRGGTRLRSRHCPEHLPRLQNAYRVDVVDSRAQGGTGLGLALVKHVLNRHGGRLTIESTLGSGAAFIMHLPFRTGDSVSADDS